MARDAAGWLKGWPPELRHPLFLALAALYVFSFCNRRWQVVALPALVDFHLADVLALPLLLTLGLSVMRRLYFRQPTFVLPAPWIFSTWLVVSLWFELLLPHLRPGTATADGLDVGAYAVGGLVFWRWLNRPA